MPNPTLPFSAPELRPAGLGAIACLMLWAAPATAQLVPLTPNQWREDLEILRFRLPAAHIDPFHLLPEHRFHRHLDELAKDADTASPEAMLVGIARVLAEVGEGHTSARILSPDLHAFPLLTQAQEDGIRIRRIARESERLLGARVLTVEARPIDEVLDRLSTVISADNAMGERAWVPFYLITREVLGGLGLLDGEPGLALEVERLDGVRERAIVPALPLGQVETLLIGNPTEMASVREIAPPLLRDRQQSSYWFEWVAEDRMVFVRIDRLVSERERPFAAWVDSLAAELDRRDPERLVLDLRSLTGGNHISLPLIHALIRREGLTRSGRLFVLIGRGTFSAGQNLVTLLGQHVQPLFVGEPTGGRPNHYGVLGRFTLPNSGLEIRYSRYFVQDGDPADYRHWQAPHVPAPPDVRAELAGLDPAMEAVLGFHGARPGTTALSALDSTYSSHGLDAALAAARERAAELRTGGWPVEEEINRFGYQLLRAGRTDDALAIFRLNVELFPEAWNAWDSLAEALAAAELRAEAMSAYQRSLALNGYNANARRSLRLLALER